MSPELPIYKRQCPLVLGDQKDFYVPNNLFVNQFREANRSANALSSPERRSFRLQTSIDSSGEQLETDKKNDSVKSVQTTLETCEKYQQTIDGKDIVSYLQKIPLISSIKGRQFSLLQMYRSASSYSPMATLLTPIGKQYLY